MYQKSFLNWFGDWVNDPTNASKVVDENGEPFIVYHNSRAKFDKFDKNKIRVGNGFFFTIDNKPLKAFG